MREWEKEKTTNRKWEWLSREWQGMWYIIWMKLASKARQRREKSQWKFARSLKMIFFGEVTKKVWVFILWRIFHAHCVCGMRVCVSHTEKHYIMIIAWVIISLSYRIFQLNLNGRISMLTRQFNEMCQPLFAALYLLLFVRWQIFQPSQYRRNYASEKLSVYTNQIPSTVYHDM